MTTPDYLVWLVIPAVVVWVVTVADMATRRGLTPLARALWIVSTTILFPVALVWYLVRPVGDVPVLRLDSPDAKDPRAVLAGAVDARARGVMDASAYAGTLRTLLLDPRREDQR